MKLAMRAVLRRVGVSPARGALAIEVVRRAIAKVVAIGQASTRRRSRAALKRELTVALGGEVELAESLARDDTRRALHVAQRIAERFQRSLSGKLEAGSPYRRAARAAVKETHPYVDVIARTESAAAFNAERDEVLRRSVDMIQRSRGKLLLFKTWDADLDKRTCSVCEGLHGTTVAINESFPIAMPAHPNCRCMTTVIMMPATFEYDRAA